MIPGNGTIAADLNEYSYTDWLEAVAYAYKSLHQQCRTVFLFGISLGAVLSWLTALNNKELPCAALIMCTPAIELFAKNGWLARYPLIASRFISRLNWYKVNPQIPPTHYLSLSFSAIYKTHSVMKLLRNTLQQKNTASIPMFMALADSDETINNSTAIEYFLRYATSSSRLLYYTNEVLTNHDPRIIKRQSRNSGEKIIDASHISLTNSPENYFYGRASKYKNFDHYPLSFVPPSDEQVCFQGGVIYKNLAHNPLRRISYNVDFTNFTAQLFKFTERNRES